MKLGRFMRTAKRCPRCGGRMSVVAFLTEHEVVDRIIRHLALTFVAEKPPPALSNRRP
jgi:ribosomal protein S27AE